MKKISVKLAGVLTAVAFAVTASSASALTITPELIALLQGLGVSSDVIATLTVASGGSTGSSSAACGPFTRDLTMGSTGSDVTTLQNFLMGAGQSIPAGATGYFGSQTQSALSAWQAANGVSPAAGYFGPITRSAVAMKCSTTGGSTGSTGGSTGSSSTLEGGAGSISDADFLAAYNAEEVGENEDDVEVAGLEIEADDNSDINLVAVTLDFDKTGNVSGSDDDLDDYADEVSVWFEGEEVARIEASDFDDDNNYQKTISLDDSVIDADKTGELVVAVTGVKNLDSGNVGEEWTVEFVSVRFEDAQGAIVTESSQGDIGGSTRAFTFESYATASDVEFRIQSGDNSVNDARVINIDDSDRTDNVALMSFKIKVTGADVELKDLPITASTLSLAVSGTDQLDDVFSKLTLDIDGDEFSENPTASTTVVFDDIDMVLSPGTYDVLLSGDVKATSSGTVGNGDTIAFEIGETQTNWSYFDAEDENGDNLADADKVGSETTETFTFQVDGIDADFVDAGNSTAVTVDSSDNDYATLEVVFNVTNFGDNTLYIPDVVTITGSSTSETRTAPSTSQGIGVYIQFKSTTTLSSGNIGTPYISDTSADKGTNAYEIGSGDTEEFTVRVKVQNGSHQIDGAEVRSLITGIGWAETDSATSGSVYTSDLDDFESTYQVIAD